MGGQIFIFHLIQMGEPWGPVRRITTFSVGFVIQREKDWEQEKEITIRKLFRCKISKIRMNYVSSLENGVIRPKDTFRLIIWSLKSLFINLRFKNSITDL